MVLRNPTTPVTQAVSWAVGATRVTAAAIVEVATALAVEAASSVFAVSVGVELVIVAEDVVASTEVAFVDEAVLDDVVAALTVAECFEFDWVSAGVDVGSSVSLSGSSAGVDGGVLTCVGAAVSPAGAGWLDVGWVSPPLAVCAPPLLLTMTPDPTSVLDDVAPEALVVPAAGSVPVDVDPLVEVEPLVAVPVLDVLADPVDDSPVDGDVDALVELAGDDSEDEPVVSAADTP